MELVQGWRTTMEMLMLLTLIQMPPLGFFFFFFFGVYDGHGAGDLGTSIQKSFFFFFF